MKEDRISRQQLFSQFRQQKIFNLGMVDRMFLEAEGVFSIFKADKPRAGLAILPPDDIEIMKKKNVATTLAPHLIQLLACISCGTVKETNQVAICQDCGHHDFINAID